LVRGGGHKYRERTKGRVKRSLSIPEDKRGRVTRLRKRKGAFQLLLFSKRTQEGKENGTANTEEVRRGGIKEANDRHPEFEGYDSTQRESDKKKDLPDLSVGEGREPLAIPS